MALDVVVVNYHTNELLRDFIQSYEEHAWDGCTLTVVDVESNDLGHGGPWDVYINTPDNVGYGRACNMGAETGSNDVILLANADTLLSDGLEACHNALMANESWGVLGPRQTNLARRITAGGIIGPDQAPRQRFWMEPDHGQATIIDPNVVFVSGALFFVKRKVWAELTDCPLYQEIQPSSFGAFLETPHYYEDTWCGYHARAHGYRCVFYGVVHMTHLWHASPGGAMTDAKMAGSQQVYRAACRHHGIICE